MIDTTLGYAAPMFWLAPDKDRGGRPSQDLGDGPRRGEKRRRVMIVEDELLVAFDIERIVSESGYEVVAVVDNEADAIAKAGGLAPDLILMDIRLRTGDGVDAATAIQKVQEVPVIFISANIDTGNLARISRLKRAAVIRKPFLEGELLAGIAKALERTN